jgi:hypothetical protein
VHETLAKFGLPNHLKLESKLLVRMFVVPDPDRLLDRPAPAILGHGDTDVLDPRWARLPSWAGCNECSAACLTHEKALRHQF